MTPESVCVNFMLLLTNPLPFLLSPHQAIANYDNVLEGDKIVQAALNAFGRIDIVINNAGILRDVSFVKMTQEQWDIIHKVHVEGAFKVTKAAWPHMVKQKYGRIIMTSSAAGLYGNVGQANYSAAKLALVGLSNTLAKEGAKNNVYCNVIAPIAGSRLTETVMPADLVAALDPSYVAPIVAYLCHDSSKQNGQIYETGAGFCAQVHWQRAAGVHLPLSTISPETIAKEWNNINSFEKGATYPTNLNDTMSIIMSQIGAKSNIGLGKPSQLTANGANGSETFASDAIFEQLASAVKSEPTISTKVNAVFQYNITTKSGAKKTWTASMLKKEGAGSVYPGPVKEGKKVDVTIDVSDEDYVALAAGKASAQMLYMKGRLKMKGSETHTTHTQHSSKAKQITQVTNRMLNITYSYLSLSPFLSLSLSAISLLR